MRNFKWRLFLRKRNCRNSSHSILCETAELQVTDCSVCESRTAELRDIVYSLCGSETAELQVTEYSCGGGTVGLKVKALVWKRNCETSSRTKFIVWKRNCVTSKPQYFPCAEAELHHVRAPNHTLFCMRKRKCGTLSLRIFHVWKRNCRTSSHIIVCVRKRNFKSHKSLYVESLWFLMQESEVPGSAGPKAPVSKPSWRCCSQLCHLGGGPYWHCFSLLRSYQAWSNQLTCDKDSDIRQTSWPKTARAKLPKGPIRRDESDFLTLQECPRKGFSPVLPRDLAGAYWPCHAHCESHVF